MRDYIDASAFKDMLLCADAALGANVQMINELNVFPFLTATPART